MRATERLGQSPSAEFIAKWRGNPLSERAGAQAFFLDLCDLLGVEKPNDPDNYCFERGALRTGAGRGWADVWKRKCFAWENKRPRQDLGVALKQLMTYALALDNPPLLVVCDREVIQIHTHFTGTPSEAHTIRIEDIGSPENLQKLRWLFSEPEKFRPRRTVHEITADAAGRFADLAQALTARGHEPQAVAHFLIQCLFCMFAEDVDLLSEKLFERAVVKSTGSPKKLASRLGDLFKSMRTGGEFGLEEVQWFNGGLFEIIEPIPLEAGEAQALLEAASMDWSQIEPSIFGTLFERGLDPALRAQLGANYTDPETIRKIIDPVVVAPLAEEWEVIKGRVTSMLAATRKELTTAEVAAAARLTRAIHTTAAGESRFQARQREVAKKVESQKGLVTKAEKQAKNIVHAFIHRLRDFRVLDAACGSGNFLYLSLRALKDLEHRVNLDGEALGIHRQLIIETSPANVMGIELNPYAAELARVTIWIGEIQWMLKHGYEIRRNPILSKLDHIECRDAVVNPDGTEPEWPAADAIVGNPPFVGNKRMRGTLGEERVIALRSLYRGRVPGGADYVTYWFEKARAQFQVGRARYVGLVATNSIRGGASRKVLERIASTTQIFEAWSNEPWINEGAAVRVSLICFGTREDTRLDGNAVPRIFADLSAGICAGSANAPDLTRAVRLLENTDTAFMGITKVGPFDVDGETARSWLRLPNPNGLNNSNVLRPSWNGLDVTRRPRDRWIVDFGVAMSEAVACLYEAPFAHVANIVRPMRAINNRDQYRLFWWRHGEPRPALRQSLSKLPRYIATPEVAKHRIFVFVTAAVLPDKNLQVIARSDDVTFGILHSRFHELWSLRLGTSLEDRPRYTPTTTFETFPFPVGLTPRDSIDGEPAGPQARAVAAAARRLNEFRENWLNPPEWTERVQEVVPEFPDRVVARPGHEADLRKRTLTALYNKRPAWLERAHQQLDAAVAAAYGWADYTSAMTDDEILRRLLALNQVRTGSK